MTVLGLLPCPLLEAKWQKLRWLGGRVSHYCCLQQEASYLEAIVSVGRKPSGPSNVHLASERSEWVRGVSVQYCSLFCSFSPNSIFSISWLSMLPTLYMPGDIHQLIEILRWTRKKTHNLTKMILNLSRNIVQQQKSHLLLY